MNSSAEVLVDDGILADGELLGKQDSGIAREPAGSAGKLNLLRKIVGLPSYTSQFDAKGAPKPVKEIYGTCAIASNDSKYN